MADPTTNTGTCPSSPPLSHSASSPINVVSAPLILPLSLVMLVSLTSNRATRISYPSSMYHPNGNSRYPTHYYLDHSPDF
ncbi:hypothetical protein Lal_00039096 [Lupinus albus]|nr:hypothetical protein Lal_00039096 [Lupinus albus]